MNKLEQIKSLLDRLKKNSGENFAAIESVASEIEEFSSGLLLDNDNLADINKDTVKESMSRKNKLKEHAAKIVELEALTSDQSGLSETIKGKDTTIKGLEDRLEKHDKQAIDLFKSRFSAYKLADSDKKKFFLGVENLDDMTVEEARANDLKLNEFIEIGVFERSSADTNKPPNENDKPQKDPFADIYKNSDYK